MEQALLRGLLESYAPLLREKKLLLPQKSKAGGSNRRSVQGDEKRLPGF